VFEWNCTILSKYVSYTNFQTFFSGLQTANKALDFCSMSKEAVQKNINLLYARPFFLSQGK
jgi:hypothetical protein